MTNNFNNNEIKQNITYRPDIDGLRRGDLLWVVAEHNFSLMMTAIFQSMDECI